VYDVRTAKVITFDFSTPRTPDGRNSQATDFPHEKLYNEQDKLPNAFLFVVRCPACEIHKELVPLITKSQGCQRLDEVSANTHALDGVGYIKINPEPGSTCPTRLNRKCF
jgi:hypothetical protein